MRLTINRSRIVSLSAAEGVAGMSVGRLRDGIDLADARRECARVNRDVLAPLRGSHGAALARLVAAKRELQHCLTEEQS